MPGPWRKDGRDYNFYQKIDVSWSQFGENTDGYAPDIQIKFVGNSLMMLNENSSNVVEYSFNGQTVHGELDPTLPTRAMVFDNRQISYIWFRIKSGSSGPVKVRVDAW